MSRRETPAPFWITGLNDGHTGSYYTFGGPHLRLPARYLETLRKSFESVTSVLRRGGYVVQLVGFADPEAQLDPYLDILTSVGLEEASVHGQIQSLRREWRTVPNRRWYADLGRVGNPSKEALLVHRKVGD